MCSALQTRTYNRSQFFSNSCLRKSESHSQAGSATYNLCISDLCRINISNPGLQSQKLRENLQKPSAWSHVSRGSHITPCTLFLLPFTFVPATGRFPKKVHDLHHWSQYPFVFGLIHTHRVLFDLLDFRRYLSSRSPSPSLDGGPDLFYQPLDKSKWTMLDIRCTTWTFGWKVTWDQCDQCDNQCDNQCDQCDQCFLRKAALSYKRELAGMGGTLRWGFHLFRPYQVSKVGLFSASSLKQVFIFGSSISGCLKRPW